jgi:hypothetical protein
MFAKRICFATTSYFRPRLIGETSLLHRRSLMSQCATPATRNTSSLPDHYLPESDKFNAGHKVRQTRATEREYFVQAPPRIGKYGARHCFRCSMLAHFVYSAYLEDAVLRDVVRAMVPKDKLAAFEHDLVRFGDRVATEV